MMHFGKIFIKRTQGCIPVKILQDPSISFSAKGIYSLINSLNDGVNLSITKISQYTNEGVIRVRNAVRELEDKGVLVRIKTYSYKEKRYNKSIYLLLDEPLNVDEIQRRFLYVEELEKIEDVYEILDLLKQKKPEPVEKIEEDEQENIKNEEQKTEQISETKIEKEEKNEEKKEISDLEKKEETSDNNIEQKDETFEQQQEEQKEQEKISEEKAREELEKLYQIKREMIIKQNKELKEAMGIKDDNLRQKKIKEVFDKFRDEAKKLEEKIREYKLIIDPKRRSEIEKQRQLIEKMKNNALKKEKQETEKTKNNNIFLNRLEVIIAKREKQIKEKEQKTISQEQTKKELNQQNIEVKNISQIKKQETKFTPTLNKQKEEKQIKQEENQKKEEVNVGIDKTVFINKMRDVDIRGSAYINAYEEILEDKVITLDTQTKILLSDVINKLTIEEFKEILKNFKFIRDNIYTKFKKRTKAKFEFWSLKKILLHLNEFLSIEKAIQRYFDIGILEYYKRVYLGKKQQIITDPIDNKQTTIVYS